MAHSCHCTNQCEQCGTCCMFPCAHRGPLTGVFPIVPQVPVKAEPVSRGWICPRCDRIHSPYQSTCWACDLDRGNTPS